MTFKDKMWESNRNENLVTKILKGRVNNRMDTTKEQISKMKDQIENASGNNKEMGNIK